MKKRLLMVAGATLAVIPLAVLSLPGHSNAATIDSAAASVDPEIALVGDPVTFTSTNPCTTACQLTWRRPDIGLERFGGVIVGRGTQFTMTFTATGRYPVRLDLSETCDGTTRLVCHSYASVLVEIVTEMPVDVPPVDVPPVDVPPVDVPPVDVPPVDVPPVDVPPVDVPPVDVPPVDVPPVDVPPVDVPPVDVPPVDVPPVDVPPPLAAPNDLSSENVSGTNLLTWTNPETSATVLILERCEGAECTSFEPIATLATTTTSFIESRTGSGGDEYTYRLAASDSTGTVYSNTTVASSRH